MADFRSSYWGQVNFWESAGAQIIDRLESSTSSFENIASDIFDGYLIDSSNSYIKVGLKPSGSAEVWGGGFMGDVVEGISISRIRFEIGRYSGDASGLIRFGSGIYGDIYPYGSLSNITYQYPGVIAGLSGNLQFSPDGEITPKNATETTTISSGPSVTSKTNAVGDYYQHKISYQGKTLTIDGSWKYESLGSYLDLVRGDDVFFGSSSDDFFTSNPGNDRLEGGSGVDTAIYSAPYSSYTIDITNPDSVKIQKSGEIDTLLGVEYLKFSDQTIAISDLVAAATRASKVKEVSAGIGDEIFQGSDGILDVVRLSSELSKYRIQKIGSAVVITDQFGNGGADTLVGIERVQFTSKALAFDIEGVAGKGYRVYKAAFNREPDQGGLGYWIDQMDDGMDMVDVAARFIDSNEFRSLYGQNPTNAEFLTKVYTNVLGRTPDQGGYDWWLNELNTNPSKTRAKVLADFAESGENQVGVASLIGNGITYEPWVG